MTSDLAGQRRSKRIAYARDVGVNVTGNLATAAIIYIGGVVGGYWTANFWTVAGALLAIAWVGNYMTYRFVADTKAENVVITIAVVIMVLVALYCGGLASVWLL